MKYEEIKLEYSPEWKGPVKERSSTDKPFLAIFTVFMICWVAVGCYAVAAGDINSLLTSKDYEHTENVLDTAISTRGTILGLIAASAVVSLLSIYLLKWIAVPVVIVSAIAWCSVSIYLACHFSQLYNADGESLWLTFSIIFGIKAAIIILMVVCLWGKIRLACEFIKEASKAVTGISLSVFFPLLPWLLQLAALTYLLLVGAYLFTIKTLEGWQFNVLFGIHFVGYVWFHCFITAFAEMSLAGAFATWYWTFKKSDVTSSAVATCTWRTMRYHLGTVAFGSLIITICRLIRYLLESVRSSRSNDPCCLVARIIACCAAHLMVYVERFVKYMNRNAYVICAVYGKGLCSSASDAMSLILRNVLEVLILNNVVSWVLWLVKISVTVLMGTLAWSIYASTKTGADTWWVPIVLVSIGAYTVADVFFTTYDVAVDTIFLCYLEDCERNDGSEQRPYYMSRQLRTLLYKETDTSFVAV